MCDESDSAKGHTLCPYVVVVDIELSKTICYFDLQSAKISSNVFRNLSIANKMSLGLTLHYV